MARVSIYVPDELKARMDEAGDSVNWSEVARPAFTAALAAFNHRKGQNMESAIERLRASKELSEKQDQDIGKAEGRMVAKDLLDYDNLVALSKVNFDQVDEDNAYALLKGALDPNNEESPREFNEMYFTNDGAEVSGAFALGFIEGAQEFFDEIKDKL